MTRQNKAVLSATDTLLEPGAVKLRVQYGERWLKSGHVQAIMAQDEKDRIVGLRTMDKAGTIARQLGKDNHSYHFKTDVDHYHIDKGSALLALGRPKDAIAELSQASEKPAFTRRNVYRDILTA